MTDGLPCGVFLYVAQAGEVVQDFPLRARVGRGQFTAFFEGADLFERERVALDGGGGVDVAGAGVLLQGGNPRKLHGGGLDALAQGGDGLDLRQDAGGDRELWLVAHAISQA